MIARAQRWLAAHPAARTVLLVVYYTAVIATLVVMYGRGNFETPEFVYQEF